MSRRTTWALLTLCLLSAGVVVQAQRRATGSTLRWSILKSTEDSRDREMLDFDIRMDERLVDVLNTSEVFDGRLQAVVTIIEELLESRSAFASLHFDPTRPIQLTAKEEDALTEFMARGGFLLLIENNYAYPTPIYRRPTSGTLFEFFANEVPQRDPKFRAEKLELTHPMFQGPYEIVVPPSIAREMEYDNYVGETAFFYEDQMVGYTYALYGFDDGHGFVPLPRPFRVYTLMDAGYRMLVNIYHYALSH